MGCRPASGVTQTHFTPDISAPYYTPAFRSTPPWVGHVRVTKRHPPPSKSHTLPLEPTRRTSQPPHLKQSIVTLTTFLDDCNGVYIFRHVTTKATAKGKTDDAEVCHLHAGQHR